VPSGELPETGGAPGRLLLIATGLLLLGLMLRRRRHIEA
jgi:LPXTG-motif cell wall-anchored protein